MKPYDQLVKHDPDNGQYGDCQRACIASLLEIPPESVPHFNDTGNADDFFERLGKYMRTIGVVLLEVNAFEFPLRAMSAESECYHMIYGNTERGTFHAVVGLNGEIVHDPHPSRAGLIEDGEWEYGFLIISNPKLFNKMIYGG